MVAKADDDQSGGTSPITIAAAIAISTAALTAIGLSGDALTRAIRNDPGGLGTPLRWTVALAGAATAAALLTKVASASSNAQRAVAAVSAVVVLGITVTTFGLIGNGIEAIQRRDEPSVTVSSATEEGVATLTVTGKGTGLASSSSMLVQLVGLRPGAEVAFDEVCAIDGRRWEGGVSEGGDAVLLGWQEQGPDDQGVASGTFSAEIDRSSFERVCGYAAFSVDGEQRRAIALLVLDPLAGDATATTTTTR
ncbi:MAG: hypothetical protein R2702_07970 [Acidimicrobiales bacterium]